MESSRASAPSRAATRLLELGLLLITPLIFYRAFSEQFTYVKLVLTEALVLIGAAGLVLGLVWGRLRWPKDSRLSTPLALLVLAVLFSCWNSPVRALSFVEGEYFLGGPVWLLLLMTWGDGEPGVRRIAGLVALAGAIVAGIALAQWAGHDPLQFGGYYIEWGTLRAAMRLYSTFGNPNFVAGYLVGAIFLALALTATSKTPVARTLSGMAVLVTFVAIIGTHSRGAWLGLAAGLLVARPIWKRRDVSPPALPAGSLASDAARVSSWALPVAVIMMLPDLLRQAQTIWSHLGGRLYLARAAWPMFAEHPLLGSGWGTFQLRFPELQAQVLGTHPEFARYWTHTRQLHNDPLQILLEAGALGLVALGWLLWTFGSELRQTTSRTSRTERLWLGASVGGVTAITIDSIFNFQLTIPPTLILLFTLLAIPQVLRPGDDDAALRLDRPEHSGWGVLVRALASVLVVAMVALLALGIARGAIADHRLALGLAQEREGRFARAEQDFRAGLEHAPDDGPLHYGLSRALYVQGQYPEALREALLAQQRVADSNLEVLKARIQDRMRYSSPALETYRHALWLNPTLRSVRADIDRLTR